MGIWVGVGVGVRVWVNVEVRLGGRVVSGFRVGAGVKVWSDSESVSQAGSGSVSW